MTTNKKTKIVATLGPACSTKEVLKAMIEAGVNVFRVNFSHADYTDVKAKIDLIRSINEEFGYTAAILGDLQGPKLRVGVMNEEVIVNPGDIITFQTSEDVPGTKERVYMNYKEFPNDVNPGENILLDDGKLMFEVVATNKTTEVVAKVIQGGPLKSKKGVNLPNTKVSLPALTEKDVRDAIFAIENKELYKDERNKLRFNPPMELKKFRAEAKKHLENTLISFKAKNKVGIVSGGGSGHLPVFTGYVGKGMLDACAVGSVFASPSVDQIASAIRNGDNGNGVLCVLGNYGGDVMNFEMACEIVKDEGIETKTIIVSDDNASASSEEKLKRRGIAGLILAFKIAGATAESGASLEKVFNITSNANSNLRTIGVAVSSCILPEVGKPTFNLESDEIEIGMGIHGEPGIKREKLRKAADDGQVGFKKLFPIIKEGLEKALKDPLVQFTIGLKLIKSAFNDIKKAFEIFKELATEFKQSLLIVTHDPEFALNSDRIIEMEDGKIISQ